MEIAVTLICGMLGSAGLFGFIQFMISRHDKKDKELAEIKKLLRTVDKKSDRNAMAVTRLQLFFLIKNEPENEEAIEMTAERYFIELDGNAEAWTTFHRWAKEHKVDTGWYKALLERERRNNNVSN